MANQCDQDRAAAKTVAVAVAVAVAGWQGKRKGKARREHCLGKTLVQASMLCVACEHLSSISSSKNV